MGFWQTIEDEIELRLVVPEFEEEDHLSDGLSPDQHRRIGEALLSILHSRPANDEDVNPSDPRIPAAVRDLHPVSIQIFGGGVFLWRTNSPERYKLLPDEKASNTWTLVVSGTDFPSLPCWRSPTNAP
jgi:hypothetical protein